MTTSVDAHRQFTKNADGRINGLNTDNIDKIVADETRVAVANDGNLDDWKVSDTTLTQNIFGLLGEIIKSPLNAMYDEQTVRMDNGLKLYEKAVAWGYPKLLNFKQKYDIFDPIARHHGVTNLRKADFDMRYLNPALTRYDLMVMHHFEPMFFGREQFSQEYLDANSSSIGMGCTDKVSLAHRLQEECKNIDKLVAEINEDPSAISADVTSSYRSTYSNLVDLEKETQEKLLKMTEDMDECMKALKKTHVTNEGTEIEYRKLRLKLMRKQFIRIQQDALKLQKLTRNARKKLGDMAPIFQEPAGSKKRAHYDDFTNEMLNMTGNIRSQLVNPIANAKGMGQKAHMRYDRYKYVYNSEGKVVKAEPVHRYEINQLQYQIEILFDPPVERKLPIVESKTGSVPNNEAFFFDIAQYIEKLPRDKETGEIEEYGKRGTKSGKDLAQHVAELYCLGEPENALRAVLMAKRFEGTAKVKIFADDMKETLQKRIKDRLTTPLNEQQKKQGITNSPDVLDDENCTAFIDMAMSIANEVGQSPQSGGQRHMEAKAAKKMLPYLLGTMYPGKGSSYMSVPLHMRVVQKPIAIAKHSVITWLLGGGIKDLDRPKNDDKPLETAAGKQWDINWLWWNFPEKKDEEKPKGFVGKWMDRYKYGPAWMKMPIRWAQIGCLATAGAMIVSGGVFGLGAPAVIAINFIGLTGGLNIFGRKMGMKTLKAPWFQEPMKKLIKTVGIAAIIGGLGYAGFLAYPTLGPLAGALMTKYPLIANAGLAMGGIFGISAGLKIKEIAEKASKPKTVKTFEQVLKEESEPDGYVSTEDLKAQFEAGGDLEPASSAEQNAVAAATVSLDTERPKVNLKEAMSTMSHQMTTTNQNIQNMAGASPSAPTLGAA